MHGMDIVKGSEQLHIRRFDADFFPGFSQGRGQQVGIFGVADPARKGEFASVVVQVWRPSGNQQIEAGCRRRERQQDRGRRETGWQGA